MKNQYQSSLFSLMNSLVGSGYSRKNAYAEAKLQIDAQTDPSKEIKSVWINSKSKGWNKRIIIGKIMNSSRTLGLVLMNDLTKILNGEKSTIISTYEWSEKNPFAA